MSGRPKLLPEIGTGISDVGLRDRLHNISQGIPGIDAYGTQGGAITGVPYLPEQIEWENKMRPKPKSKPTQAEPKMDSDITGKSGLVKAYKIRSEVLRMRSSGDYNENFIVDTIRKAGINDQWTIEAILGTDLNENIIKYFLAQSDNNSDKALALAKKFGY